MMASPECLTATLVLTDEEVVSSVARFPAVTSTTSDAAATFKLMSTFVRFDDCT